MGERMPPMIVSKITTTEDAIICFEFLTAECRS
jgi:hypothetical protein